ncbi:MAG TPA: YtxH domain-containing protein, partial [Terriglobales bacterium]|nr:YtxH domain-containing protein [Terriglobales bacterium]
MSDRDSGNSLLWFLAGLGIGAAVGVLYAPRSGSETREALLARAEEGREYMRERAREAREQASDWVDKGREVVT